MADQITDGRTLVDNADVANPGGAGLWEDIGGSVGVVDAEIFIEGAGSIGEFATTTRAGTFWNFESALDFSNNVFYIWFNSGIVGLLDTKVNAGVTVRFTGATATDFFEVFVAGSDDFPPAINGGWVMFVVDIEDAKSKAEASGTAQGTTGGTSPATTAIQRVGITFITAATMPRMADNCWVDAIWRLPDGSPGIIVEGRDGGSSDWDWSDIVAASDAGAWGTAKLGFGGSIVLNTPIQFGISDGSAHAFLDTNKIILWDDQEFAPEDLYKLSALGNSGGTTNVTMGIKTGTGDDATGAQGCIIQAAEAGVRFSFDFDDPDLDGINLFGCQFIHGGDFQLDDPACSLISTTFLDCTSAVINNAGDFLRCKVINSNTVDGVAFLFTDDFTDIVFCEFEFSDGYAVEILSPLVATQSNKGNKFTGFGIDSGTDAAVFNNSGGTVTLGNSEGADSPTIDHGSGAATIVQNFVTIRILVLDDQGADLENARVEVIADETIGTITIGDILLTGLTNVSGIIEETQFNYEGAFDPSGLDHTYKVRKSTDAPLFRAVDRSGTIISVVGFNTIVQMALDE